MTNKVVMPANRRANIRHNEKTGRWDFNVRLVRQDGSQFRRAGSAATEAEARAKRDHAYAEFNRDGGAAIDAKKRAKRERTDSLRTWATYVHKEIWPHTVAKTSRDAYMYILGKHVLPKLGNVPISEVTTHELQSLVNELWNSGRHCAARQARSSMSNLYAVAVSQGKAQINPASGVVIMDVRRRTIRDEVTEETRRLLSQAELSLLLEVARDTDMYLPILLGAKLGLRIGEALGLEWRHVDLDKMSVRVSQQLQWVKGEGNVMVPPKSAASVRSVPIPPSIADELRFAKAVATTPYVCTRKGELFPSKKHHVHFRTVLERAGLSDPQPTFHNLRGTYLTYMANVVGVKPAVLMSLAGHGTVEVTMRYYVQTTSDDLRAAVANL